MTLKIAFLGTGIMGAPMAINVVRGGRCDGLEPVAG